MTSRATTNIGTLAAIPLLLALLALAAFVYVASATTTRPAARTTTARRAPDVAAAPRAAERERLTRAIAEADAKIRTLEEQTTLKARIPATDLVPTGTRRPAVFVECTADGAWIMPERHQLATTASAADGAVLLDRLERTRFAVFLVRPSGFRTFAAYRAVLERYNASRPTRIDFGFEPVDAGWQLAYPDATRGGT